MHNCGREMAARASGAAAVRGDGAKDQGRRRIGGPRDGGWRTLTQKLRAKMGRPESKESARRFSIIITCYNQREYIGEAVQSAISQGGRLKEVLVVAAPRFRASGAHTQSVTMESRGIAVKVMQNHAAPCWRVRPCGQLLRSGAL